MNLRSDNKFVEDEGWQAAAMEYEIWLTQHQDRKVVFLEIGVGYNTPGIIKYAFWQQVYQNKNATYACLNMEEERVPEKIRELEWEIREIRSKDPYQYKNLFSRPELVGEKHLDLQRQAEEYRQYSAQLEEKLGSILPEGTLLIWSHEW
jgi:hypothetical protein